jgi:PKD repeat protein
MVRNGHTQANPKVEMFMTTPSGSEPTGMTFTPDERFMFISIQSPSPLGTTIQKDAAGNNVIMNRNSALVIGRREVFTPGYKAAFTINNATQCLTGNSFTFTDSLLASNKNNVWLFGNGQSSTQRNATYSYNLAGNYTVRLATENAVNGCRDTASKSVTVYAKPSNITITGAVTTNRGTVQNYTATAKAGATYQWWIENGTQTTGTNTNAISVTWSNSATAGKVSAQEIDANTCKGDTANLTISLTNVGINDAKLIDGLKVYPNPTKNDLFIESNENVTVIITDISGKKLFETKNQTGEILTIDLSAYSAGSYLVSISSSKHTVTRQIVKH